jgi:hypothetical protein
MINFINDFLKLNYDFILNYVKSDKELYNGIVGSIYSQSLEQASINVGNLLKSRGIPIGEMKSIFDLKMLVKKFCESENFLFEDKIEDRMGRENRLASLKKTQPEKGIESNKEVKLEKNGDEKKNEESPKNLTENSSIEPTKNPIENSNIESTKDPIEDSVINPPKPEETRGRKKKVRH